jgi:hypothetical protein
MPATRPDTHVQFRLPHEVTDALDEQAASLGRSRAVTAKLLLTKLLAPSLYRSWMAELKANPERSRLPKT